MPDVAVIGGGPAGLSAALLTAKNGLETVVFDTGKTSVNKAYLRNYLGVRDMPGPEFMERAREHATDFGADLQEREVERVKQTLDGFSVHTAYHEYDAQYVVLATGYDREIAEGLGCEFRSDEEVDEAVRVDLNYETTVDDVYAVGWTARPDKIQVAISVGSGAAAALDILSKERGERYHDFDHLPDFQD